jgi:RNA polymerase sigma-70 factor (ECF subfamily)
MRQPAVEERIRARIAAGDFQAAVADAVRGYGPEIASYLRTVLRDRDAADDAFSRFCELVWRGIRKYRGEASFRVWAYRIAWGAVGEQLRDPYRRRRQRLPTTELNRIVARTRSSAGRRRSGVHDLVERLRADLTPEDQTLLMLRVDRDLSWRDVARVLAAGGDAAAREAALRKRFERLRARVRRAVERSALHETA